MKDTRMRSGTRPLLGLGLIFLFAAGMLAGIRYGNAAVWRLHLDPVREPLPILMYHNVVNLPEGTEYNDMTVSPAKLREDFDYIKERGYTPVLPRDLLDPENLPAKPILITFDDGYENMYNILYPMLQEYNFKAAIAVIVNAPDVYAETFCNWYAYREMVASGLVEVGSHSYNLHNPDNNGMNYPKSEPNGIQRKRFESTESFQTRVLDDIQKSYDRITEEIGVEPVFFAYPFGAVEPEAQALLDELFPVSVTTIAGTADMARGLARMPRWTVTMDTPLLTMVG